MMFKVVTETLGVANVLRTPIYAAIGASRRRRRARGVARTAAVSVNT